MENKKKDLIFISDNEKQKRIMKYLLQALIVAVAVKYIPQIPLETSEICTISILSAIVFAILDTYSPSISLLN